MSESTARFLKKVLGLYLVLMGLALIIGSAISY